jgi:hypothetical protein
MAPTSQSSYEGSSPLHKKKVGRGAEGERRERKTPTHCKSIIPNRRTQSKKTFFEGKKIRRGSIPSGSLKRSLGMAKLQEWCNHPQILRI